MALYRGEAMRRHQNANRTQQHLLSYENDLCDRLRQLPLTTTLGSERKHWIPRPGNYWQRYCDAMNTKPVVRASTLCNRAVTGISRSDPHRSTNDPRLFVGVKHQRCASSCVLDLCIVGRKAKLHRREAGKSRRLRNYWPHLTQNKQETARRKAMPKCKTTSGARKEKNDSKADGYKQTRTRICVIPSTQLVDLDQDATPENMDQHRYIIARSPRYESADITVMIPNSPLSDTLRAGNLQRPSFSLSIRSCTESDSHLSFSNVDFSLTCKTPDDSLTPTPQPQNKLYPIACPAFSLDESFPACDIPEPDVW
eukprot:gene18889-20791_t